MARILVADRLPDPRAACMHASHAIRGRASPRHIAACGCAAQSYMAAEKAYALEGCADDLRTDGRSRLDYRPLSVELGLFAQAGGSARVRMGGADVIVGVTAELSEPDAATPEEGRILVSVDYSRGGGAVAGLPDYGGAHSDDALLWLEAALQPIYAHESVAETLRSLCIVAGAQCWQLRVHAQLVGCDGCPLDAISLGVKAALHNTRVPKAVVASGDGGAAGGAQLDLDLDESLDESVAFDAAALPLYVTLATLGEHAVADCTVTERRAAGSALSLALDPQGRVCAVRGGGGFGINLAQLADAMQTARYLATGLLKAAQAAIEEAAQQAEAAGSTDCALSFARAV